MQKKLNKFIKKEIEIFLDVKYIEALTFEQLKKIPVQNDYVNGKIS